MAGVAPQPGGVEAGLQLRLKSRGAGVTSRLGRQGQAQQQHIRAAAVLQALQHVGGAATVEQEVGVRGLQVDVGLVQRQGALEGGFGGGKFAPAFFDLGQAGQTPEAFTDVSARFDFE